MRTLGGRDDDQGKSAIYQPLNGRLYSLKIVRRDQVSLRAATGSVNHRVEARLRELPTKRAAYGKLQSENER